jgi:rare lipoprotein A
VGTVRGGVTVYRPAAASWYGPGLMGGHLACGGTLDAGVVGVANKSMPCGSRVKLRYRGRTVTARVVDRGPYSGAREFDLTPATKERLGFGSTGTVWASRAD